MHGLYGTNYDYNDDRRQHPSESIANDESRYKKCLERYTNELRVETHILMLIDYPNSTGQGRSLRAGCERGRDA